MASETETDVEPRWERFGIDLGELDILDEGSTDEPDTVDKAHEGRLLKTDFKQRYTLGVVYEPDTEDSQGDFARIAEIEKAAWAFMRGLQAKADVAKLALTVLDGIHKAMGNGVEVRLDVSEMWDELAKAGPLNDMHVEDGDFGEIVESYTAPVDITIDTPQGPQTVKKGSWLMGVVWTPEYFAKVERGERTGYSMEGKGRRIVRDAI